MGSRWGLATIIRSLMERSCFSEPNSLAAKRGLHIFKWHGLSQLNQ